jgi:hypothetical protein
MKMTSWKLFVVAACLAVLAIAGLSTAGLSVLSEAPAATAAPANLSLALATEETRAPQCRTGVGESGQCAAAGVQVAAGAECPATSGSYCSDELPYCCGTPGNYYCAKDVNGC